MSTSSCLDNSNGDAADFECNICLDLAQEPIVTLCGHLFCWPCIYKWLHSHASSQNCPVCKAVIEEGKLVPLYGRGKNFSDPRSKSTPDVNIPHRPAAGQRQETAPPSYQDDWGMGGFSPLTSATIDNPIFSAGSWPNVGAMRSWHLHLQGSHTAASFFAGAGRFAFGMTDQGRPQNDSGQQDSTRKKLLFFIGWATILTLFWC